MEISTNPAVHSNHLCSFSLLIYLSSMLLYKMIKAQRKQPTKSFISTFTANLQSTNVYKSMKNSNYSYYMCHDLK